jgi:hypothetical protein
MAMNVGVEVQGVHLIVIFGTGHHLINWLEYEYVRSATGYSIKKVKTSNSVIIIGDLKRNCSVRWVWNAQGSLS